MKDNFIKDYWELLESTSSIPTKVNKVLILDFNEIEQNILEEDQEYLKKLWNLYLVVIFIY